MKKAIIVPNKTKDRDLSVTENVVRELLRIGIIPYVDDEFDYKVEFFVKADGNLGNANAVIANFNSLLYTQDADKIKTFKKVTFYNDYKKVKIVGYPTPIAEATDFWRDSKGKTADVVCVEWTIKVNDPTLCDFNI